MKLKRFLNYLSVLAFILPFLFVGTFLYYQQQTESYRYLGTITNANVKYYPWPLNHDTYEDLTILLDNNQTIYFKGFNSFCFEHLLYAGNQVSILENVGPIQKPQYQLSYTFEYTCDDTLTNPNNPVG